MTQVGPNRLYIDKGFQPLNPLCAHRGYYSSVRPGREHILLNVNAAASAFFPPCRIAYIVNRVQANTSVAAEVDTDEIEKWLKGTTLKMSTNDHNPRTALVTSMTRSRD
jgi:hypothetical protein